MELPERHFVAQTISSTDVFKIFLVHLALFAALTMSTSNFDALVACHRSPSGLRHALVTTTADNPRTKKSFQNTHFFELFIISYFASH